MKKFLAVYIGATSALEKAGWESMSEEKRREQQKAGMEAWRGSKRIRTPSSISELLLERPNAYPGRASQTLKVTSSHM